MFNKHVKKVVSAALIATMTVSIAACGSTETATTDNTASEGTASIGTDESGVTEEQTASSENEAATKLTLILRSDAYANVIKECLPAFEEEHNVSCEVLELSEEDLHSKIALDALNEEGAYDLCMVDGSWMAEFTNNGVLADLTELGYELDDDIIPATTKICYGENGDVYLAPYYGNVTVLLYNKANVENAGYNADSMDSLQDLLTVCQTAQENGQKGFIYRGDTENNIVVDFLPILLSYGGWVIDENNQPTVNSEEFINAMNFYMELIATGEAEVKDDLIASVDSGAATMGIGWPGWYVPSDDTTAGYVALNGAAEDGSEAYNANVYGVWTLGVTQNSTNKELAEELLEYLMDPDVQLSTVADGGVPCRYSSLQNEEVLAEYPQYEIVCEALESGVYRPVIEEWTDFYTILGTEMGNIINGVKTVEDGLNDAQSQLEDLMK